MLTRYQRAAVTPIVDKLIVVQHADFSQVEQLQSLKEILARQKRIIVRNVPGASEVAAKEDGQVYSREEEKSSGVRKERMETFTVGERPPGFI